MFPHNFSRSLGLALVVSACSIFSQSAEAAVIDYSGSFSITFDTGAPDYQGVPSLSGSWSFEFDDSVVTGNPNGFFENVALATISLDLPVGVTTFTTVNTTANLQFSGGVLSVLTLGGIAGGDPGAVDWGWDDWLVDYNGAGTPVLSYVSSGSVGGMQAGSIQSGSFTAVPEAGSSLIALALLPAFAFVRKRRA